MSGLASRIVLLIVLAALTMRTRWVCWRQGVPEMRDQLLEIGAELRRFILASDEKRKRMSRRMDARIAEANRILDRLEREAINA